MSDTQYQYFPSKIRMWAVITDTNGSQIAEPLPVSTVKIVYQLQAIPTAAITVATGVNASNPTSYSPIHSIKRSDLFGKTITIRCQLSGTAGDTWDNGSWRRNVQWPEEAFTVFQGKISGIGVQRGQGLSTTISIDHWMCDLDATSWLSSLTDVGSSNYLTTKFAPAIREMASSPSVIKDVIIKNGVAADKVMSDNQYWVNFMKPFLIQIAEMSGSSSVANMSASTALVGLRQTNLAAVTALKKMDDGNSIVVPEILNFSKHDWFTSVKSSTVQAEFYSAWQASLGMQLFSGSDRPTLWSKLLRCCDALQSVVITNTTTATLVPFNPVGTKPWLTLSSSEVFSIESASRIGRQLRGIILVNNQPLQQMTGQPATADLENAWVVGQYDHYRTHPSLAEDPGGVFGIRALPFFLSPPEYRWSGTYFQGAGGDMPQGETPAKDVEEFRGRFANKYAEYVYQIEAAQAKTATVATRLRFDVCPGSLVKLSVDAGSLAVAGMTPSAMMGCVQSVEISIDAMTPSASTLLNLSHVRDADDLTWASNYNPVHTNTSWRGSPLAMVPGCTPSLTA